MPEPTDHLSDARQFAHSAILNWGTDQAESNAAIAAASANALISIAESLATISEQVNPARIGLTEQFLGMRVCESCGNKRCPHAVDLQFRCTGSNAPGQTVAERLGWSESDVIAFESVAADKAIARAEKAEAEVERLMGGIAELERQLDAEAKHAALGSDESCDVCTHRQAEDLIAEVDRLEAASAHEREITDKAIARAEKAESALERVRRLSNLARYKGPEPADTHAAVLDSLARELLAALDGE